MCAPYEINPTRFFFAVPAFFAFLYNTQTTQLGIEAVLPPSRPPTRLPNNLDSVMR